MSKNTLNHFLSLLLSGNIHDLVIKYYDNSVKVILNKSTKTKEKISGMNLLQQTLNCTQILQFKVVDIKYEKNKLSYEVYMVTKDNDDRIDLSEHHIINKWKNNLVYQHSHKIINH